MASSNVSLERLLQTIEYPSKDKIELVTRAYYFAEKAHAGQLRYSGEPYFNHVFETAVILAELGMGRRTISAGLLHDVLEDADISPEELEKEFGKEIVFLVKGVTKLGKIRYTESQRHVESLKKFFVAMSKDIRVLIIKLADRLHNMRTLEHVPAEKRHRIAKETMEIYVPLAYRMGIRTLKRELEDLSFKYLEPAEYASIKLAVSERIAVKNKQLEKFRRTLLKLLAREHISNVISDTRIKSMYSIYYKTKLKRKSLEEIYDIQALRLNVDTVADCYRVLGIIHSKWRPLPGRIKDYIAFPKPNGYQSLHTTILTGESNALEIQIRTQEMHENAEYGLAGHISYKELDKSDAKNEPSALAAGRAWLKQFFPSRKKNQRTRVDKRRADHIPVWIKELVDVQSYVTIPTEFIDNLKADFFEHRMFIFDANGEVIDLPVGSSVVDYAYAMDAAIANNLSGARVNDKFASLDTVLHNGDIVDVITKQNSQPRAKWIDYCRTNYAKKHIKEALEKV